MFGSGKKKKEKLAKKVEVIETEIHTIPAKFLPGGGSRPSSSSGSGGSGGGSHKLVGFLIIFGAVLLLVAGAAYYLLVIAKDEGQLPTNTNQVEEPIKNANANVNTNRSVVPIRNTNTSRNVNRSVNTNRNTNRNVNTNLNGNLNVNTNANVNTNINVNVNRNVNSGLNFNINTPKMPSSLDTDKDKLTDAEEKIYLTEILKPDSDSDGYLDGDEVVAGYDPNNAGGAKLESAAYMTKLVNQREGYEVLYPKQWLTDIDEEDSKVLFSAAYGEFIEILVDKNRERLAPKEWYAKQSPSINVSKLELVSVGDINGIKSPDGLNVYLFVEDNVFVFYYNIGQLKELSFKTTFDMMVNSFVKTPSVPAPEPPLVIDEE